MKFDLKVISVAQDLSILSLDATNIEDAQLQAKKQGYIVLSVKPQSASNFKLSISSGKFSLILFSHELHALLKAGLSLMEAMETLREKENRPHTRQILDQLMVSLYEGMPFSTSLEMQPASFSALYVAMIRASEKTGDLAHTLKSYVEYQAQVDIVKKKIVSASVYPAILLFVGSLVVLFLMLYVVPKFSVIYENKRGDLPWMSELLLAWGRVLHTHSQLVLIVAGTMLVLLIFIFTRPWLKSWLFNTVSRIPAVGERMRIYALARFYRTVGMLLKGGIPAVQSMEMTADILQSGFKSQLNEAINEIKEGVAISTAMEKHALTTPVAVRMIRVGERSGQMGDMMQNIGEFYDDEIARWVDWFTKLFEPILMTVIGLIVGLIVVLMYMPIFELAGSLQ